MKPFYALVLFPVMSFAQSAVTSTDTSAVGALTKYTEMIPASAPAFVTVGAVIVCDLIMRFWPTQKPKSVLLLIASVFHSFAALVSKMSTYLDSAVQNLKDKPDQEQK